ncbi:MAG: MXAN_5187 C-terminal domain-containing protein, partial [Myxococcota bacterium]
KKMISRLDGLRRNNTAFKFQLNSARQTLITYEQYWNRIARQIEEGTYKRDKLRAQRRLQTTGSAAPAKSAGHPPPGENAEVESLHRAYLRARSQVGDSRPVPIGSFAKTVEKQTAAIKERFNCDRVEFKVTVKEGRAILKAIPR